MVSLPSTYSILSPLLLILQINIHMCGLSLLLTHLVSFSFLMYFFQNRIFLVLLLFQSFFIKIFYLYKWNKFHVSHTYSFKNTITPSTPSSLPPSLPAFFLIQQDDFSWASPHYILLLSLDTSHTSHPPRYLL